MFKWQTQLEILRMAGSKASNNVNSLMRDSSQLPSPLCVCVSSPFLSPCVYLCTAGPCLNRVSAMWPSRRHQATLIVNFPY